MSHRLGLWALIGFMVFGFGTIIIGPDSIDPVLRSVFGLQAPEAVPPPPVPGSEEAAYRVENQIVEADIRALMDAFTKHGSRVPGYAGHDAAARFIEQRFRELGLEDVETESYGVTSPVDEGSRLTIASSGEVFPLPSFSPS